MGGDQSIVSGPTGLLEVEMPQYEMAFVRPPGRSMQLPYAVIHYVPGAVDLMDLEREAAELKAKRVDVSPRVRGIRVRASNPQADFSRSKCRLTKSYALQSLSDRPIYVTSYTFVGLTGVAKLQCFTDSANNSQVGPAFAAMADGFAWAKGFEYIDPAPAAAGTTRKPQTKNILSAAFLIAIVIVLALVLRKSVQV